MILLGGGLPLRHTSIFMVPEIDRITHAVDRPVEIHPLASELDVSSICHLLPTALVEMTAYEHHAFGRANAVFSVFQFNGAECAALFNRRFARKTSHC